MFVVCHIRRIVADNYHTITERSFRPLTVLNGTEAFPNAGKQAGSGFVREKPLHVPTFSDVSLLVHGFDLHIVLFVLIRKCINYFASYD